MVFPFNYSGHFMKQLIEKISPKNRLLTTGFAFILLLALSDFAEENDGIIFNQLYREIMSSAPARLTGSMDSIRSAIANVSSSSSPAADSLRAVPSMKKPSEASTEELKRKIDKLVRDANLRHSDAVKFMQDKK